MFGHQDAKKNEDFISKAQAARQQRAEGRQREKASIVIQAHVRKFLCISRLRGDIRKEYDLFVGDGTGKSYIASKVFPVVRRFLFIYQANRDEQRFLALCRFLIGSMDAKNDPKVWYVSLALNKENVLSWIYQLKTILWFCCKNLKTLKPSHVNEAKAISIHLTMLITFTDCSSWKIFSSKGGEALQSSLQQLCANVLGYLNSKGLFPILKELLMNGLARSEPVLKSASLTAIITMALRPLLLSNMSDNLRSLFVLNILSVPGLMFHLRTNASSCLKCFSNNNLYLNILEFLGKDQPSRIIFNSLECSYSLCLLGNLIDLSQLEEKEFKRKLREFMQVTIRLLLYCQSYVGKKQSNLTSWHPVLGWFKQNSDERLNSSIPFVVKQLNLMWQKKTVHMLFDELSALSNLDDNINTIDAGSKRSWFRLGSLKSSDKSSTVKVTESQIRLVADVCVMYQTMLVTFSQIRLDILTGLSYQEEFLLKLWRFFQVLSPDGGPKMILGTVVRGSINCTHALLSTLTLFCDCCGHLMPIVDDHEMYEKEKPFTLGDLLSMSSFLNTLVFKMLWNEVVDENKQQGGLIEWSLLNSAHTLLMLLYDRDCRRSFTPPNHWLIREIKVSTLLSELENGKKRAVQIMDRIPHIIPHRERVQLFRKFVTKDKEALGITQVSDDFTPHGTLVTVHRSRLLEDGYEQLSVLPAHVLKNVVRVRFINEQGLSEAGIDQDGVFKEFLEETVKKAFDPTLNLFKLTDGDEQRLYPSTTSNIHDDHLKLFEFLGKILGKAVYEGIVVEVPFAVFFLNHVLGHQHSVLYSSIDELPSLDAALYKSLTFIKNYDGDVRDLDLTFSFDEDVLGKVITHDLKPGGRAFPVTNDNKISYVHLMAHYRMCVQIHDQTSAFIRGFKTIINPTWLKMFSAPELQRLISGDSSCLDLGDLRKHTRYYGGYHNNHRVIIWLWDILDKELNIAEKSQFLKFVTSCSKPPLLGFAHLEPPFSIRCVECSEEEDEGDTVGSVFRGLLNIGRRKDPINRLPTASTCFNLLKLPNYRKKSTLREKLRYAITSNAGFELS